jgi:pyridoxine/pyridoxamine 5'-phosphate oxidase
MPKKKAMKKTSKKPVAKKAAAQPAGVKVSKPQMPADYLSLHKGDFLPWSHAEKRLEKSRSYWICTTRPDGRPHSMPVWGCWVDGALLFGTGLETRKAKNLTHNPAVSIHLESADDMVVFEGRVEVINPEKFDKQTLKRVDAMSRKKYKMPFTIMPGSVMYRVRPRVAWAWQEKKFPYHSTRWEFPTSP